MASSKKWSQEQIQALRRANAQKSAEPPKKHKSNPWIVAAAAGIIATGTYVFWPTANKHLDDMVSIPSGCYTMGAPGSEFGSLHPERPQHKVCLDAFQLDRTETTQDAFQKAMGSNPSHNKDCRSCPVESVTWDEAQQYCQKLGKRLPTEAEWEYAARAGTQSKFYWGDEFSTDHAWFSFNAQGSTQPVKTSVPNSWRLYDMAGNVWEWTSDWADNNYYAISPGKNPSGPAQGTSKIVRGGSYNAKPHNLRSAARGWAEPQERLDYVGFRCAL